MSVTSISIPASKRAVTWAAVLVLVLAAPTAGAQRRESAEELFQLGKAASARKDYDHACEYFRASLDNEFALGTLLNLASCHEQQGKFASAWSEFRILEDRAVRATPPQMDRAEFAHERVEALRTKLSRVRIRLSPEAKNTKGLVAKIDGVSLDSHLFDVGVPVDPGQRTLVVEAPDRETFTQTFTVADKMQDVSVPALRVVIAPPKPVTIDVAEAERLSVARSRRTAGIVVGGIGAASLATGIVFGLLAKHADGETTCSAPCYVDDPKLAAAHDAYTREKTYAWVSDVGFALGLVGLGVGTYLVLTSSTTKRTTTAGLLLGPTGASVEGSF